MEYEDFRRFDCLAQTLHFGRAAQLLHMSPSALTRRIQAMEDELGHTLFWRDPRSVRLTSAGEKFRRFARHQLDQWEQLENELRAEEQSPSGELHVACTVTACHTVLPRLLALCREKHPGITLKLITQDASRSLAQLLAGEVDLAVIPTEGPLSPDLEAIVLDSTEFSFIAPPDSQTPQQLFSEPDLKRAPFVFPLEGLERKRLDQWFEEQQAHPQIVAEVRGNEGIIAMVSLGSGVSLVPRLVLEHNPLPVRILHAVPPPPGYDVSLCTRKKSLRRATVSAFWQLAQELALPCPSGSGQSLARHP